MKTWRLVPLTFFIWSCAHTDETGASKPDAAAAPQKQEKPPPAPAAKKPEPRAPPKSASGIVLSDSPEASLTPRGFESLEEALVVRRFLDHPREHFDQAVRDALAKFQKGEGLPGTGMPDRETVRRLGLKVDDVFKK